MLQYYVGSPANGAAARDDDVLLILYAVKEESASRTVVKLKVAYGTYKETLDYIPNDKPRKERWVRPGVVHYEDICR